MCVKIWRDARFGSQRILALCAVVDRLGASPAANSDEAPGRPATSALLKLVGHTDQLRERLRSHLAHNVTAMKFYCFLRHSQLGGDLFIQKPEEDFSHHFAFPRRQ
jgi:hypothetical protein